MSDLREAFIGQQPKWPCTSVDTPDRGKQYVRMLNIDEQDEIEGKPITKETIGRLVVLFLCDENGWRVLKDEDASAVTRNVPPATVKAIVEAGYKFNGFAQQGNAVSDVEKNSPGGRSDNSGTP